MAKEIAYQLTKNAQFDLFDIYEYTITKWGIDQAERYKERIKATCLEIASGSVKSRSFSKSREDLQFIRCENHYIFFTIRKNKPTLIIAIFHERMDLIKRMVARLQV